MNKLKNLLPGAATITLLPDGSIPFLKLDQTSDLEKLADDWNIVGNDIRHSMDNHRLDDEQKT